MQDQNQPNPFNQQPPQGQPYRRISPQSDLDFNLMTTDSTWGRPNDINPELRQKLRKVEYLKDAQGNPVLDDDGKPIIDEAGLWDELDFFTRDLRLANLDEEEMRVVRYNLDLASDYLTEKHYRAFRVILGYIAGLMETSQSKKGFLRKAMNTFRTESTHQELEPPKKSLLGGNKNNQG